MCGQPAGNAGVVTCGAVEPGRAGWWWRARARAGEAGDLTAVRPDLIDLVAGAIVG